MMFVDASAIVAILTDEPDSRGLAERLQGVPRLITSPIAIYEARLAVRRKRPGPLEEARSDVETFLAEARITVVPITPADADRAWTAFGRYGKGSGHPARLNMGDCFAYAVAQGHGVPLLFKGQDFSKTDLG